MRSLPILRCAATLLLVAGGGCAHCPRALTDPAAAVRAPAGYTEGQLAAWRGRLEPLVRQGGIRSIGVEPGTNRLRVGVTAPHAVCPVARRIRAAGVPLDAVLLVPEPAPEW
jgi:hypothetical protein